MHALGKQNRVPKNYSIVSKLLYIRAPRKMRLCAMAHPEHAKDHHWF